MCVQVRPWRRLPLGASPCRQARNKQYPVEAPGLASVYWRPLEWRMTLFVKFFTESLILAQDERWRLA